MKRCLMSVVSEPFVFGAIAMLTSFQRTNPSFRDPIVIVWNSENAPLTEFSRGLIAQEVKGVVFHEVDNSAYEKVFRFAEEIVRTPKRLRAAFYILEAFRCDYDYVVALDSDMLVLGDLSALFDLDKPFAAARASSAWARAAVQRSSSACASRSRLRVWSRRWPTGLASRSLRCSSSTCARVSLHDALRKSGESM